MLVNKSILNKNECLQREVIGPFQCLFVTFELNIIKIKANIEQGLYIKDEKVMKYRGLG